jgi:transcriptional regulator with XRE-family HTH domain
MDLKQVKIECLNHNITMSELAKKLNISRVWLYNRIQKKDSKTIKKIQDIFNSAVAK